MLVTPQLVGTITFVIILIIVWYMFFFPQIPEIRWFCPLIYHSFVLQNWFTLRITCLEVYIKGNSREDFVVLFSWQKSSCGPEAHSHFRPLVVGMHRVRWKKPQRVITIMKILYPILEYVCADSGHCGCRARIWCRSVWLIFPEICFSV